MFPGMPQDREKLINFCRFLITVFVYHKLSGPASVRMQLSKVNNETILPNVSSRQTQIENDCSGIQTPNGFSSG